MSNTKVIDTKLVIVKTGGVLKELGYISGPILHPSRIKLAKVVAMVNNGKKVFEVNPDNQEETVLLTQMNVTAENFKKKVVAEAPVEEKKVADVQGMTAEIAGLGSIAREAIDPTYTPAVNTIEVDNKPVMEEGTEEVVTVTADETSVEETAEEAETVAEEDSKSEESPDVVKPAFNGYQYNGSKKNKKNRH